MKKIIAACSLVMLFALVAVAQPGQMRDTTGQAERMKQMRERQKTGLIDQAKLTPEEADKVLDIQMARMAGGGMRGMRDMSDEDRKKKMDEMQAETDKKYKAAGLSDEKIKAVQAYFAKQMQGRGGPGGPRPTPPAPPQQ